MIKNHRKLLAFLLCAALLCTLAGFTVAGNAHDDEHDHDHENEALSAVLASPLVTSLEYDAVPLADGDFSDDGQSGDDTSAATENQQTETKQTEPQQTEPQQTQAPTQTETPTQTQAPADPGSDTGTGSDNSSGNQQGNQETTTTPAPANTPCPHKWETHVVSSKKDCYYGSVEQVYEECALCHARTDTATRPAPGTWPKKEHTYTTVIKDSTCPKNQSKQLTCSVCGYSQYVQGGHTWGPWQSTSNGNQTRTCKNCGQTESKTCSHNWKTYGEDSTCTKKGWSYEQCTLCGAKRNEMTRPLAAHQYGNNSDDCTKPLTCAVCGATSKGYTSHSFTGAYSYDDNNHMQKCARCSVTKTTAHTRVRTGDCTKLGKCNVCGAPAIESGLQHSYTKVGSTYGDYHVLFCSNAGCSAQIKEAHYGTGSARCGETQWCVVCKSKVPGTGSGSHKWGSWTGTASGHTRTCTACGYTETASHTANRSGNGSCTTTITCSTCGYVVSKGYSDHSFGVWMANGSTHYRTCTHPGCTAQQSSAHTGGKATCASAAVCSVCGASYGSKAASSHTGGTEIRNEKPAEVGKAGYTGDTYCLGCGKKISSGTAIKALEADHKHDYAGAWHSDSGHHWHQCSCGERSGEAAHSFSNGKCTTCGATDPNYKVCSGNSHVGGTVVKDAVAATKTKDGYTGDLHCSTCGKIITKGTVIPKLKDNHEHEYSVAWRIDSENHWKDCTCGEISRKGAHQYVNGVCAVCGTTDPKEAEKAHAHEYGELISDGQYHWRVCTICGYQAEKTAHTVLNGSCMTCGYVLPSIAKVKDVSNKDWFYDSVKTVVEAGLLSGGKSADKNTSFKPTDEVSLADTVDALYRLAGSPIASTETKFKDVKADDYYAAAAAWVTDNNILTVKGKEFDADKSTTMEEMITFLWRFAQTAGWKTDVKGFEAPEDADEAAAAAAEAMAWAAEQGLTEEVYGGEAVTADSVVNRAEAAAILAKFMGMIEENGLPEIENGVEEVST